MNAFLTAFLLTLTSSLTMADSLKIGSSLPDVAAPNQDGDSITLTNVQPNGYLLVYFYPKADTPGCTAQACSLRDAYVELTDKQVVVIGVSKDSVKSQKKFQEKYNLPFDLLADKEAVVVKAFGVSTRMTFPSRQAYLFNNNELVWKDTSASTKKQAEDVLKAIHG